MQAKKSMNTDESRALARLKNLIPGPKNRETSEGLTRRQKLALPLLAAGYSNAEIGERLRAHPSTVAQWRKLPAVRAHLDALWSESMQRTREAIVDAGPQAVQVLREAMADQDDKASTKSLRVQAAAEVLRLQVKATDGISPTPPKSPEQADFDALLNFAAKRGVMAQLRARGCPEELLEQEADAILCHEGAREAVLTRMSQAAAVPDQ